MIAQLFSNKLVVFIAMTALCLILEFCFPARKNIKKFHRLKHNYLLVGINNIFIYMLTLLCGFNLIMAADRFEWGILKWVGANLVTNFVITILVMDLVIYWQHRLFHHFDFLWKFHRVHHYDTELDFSTGIRFHPVEIMISFVVKLITVLLLGADGLSVMWFEIILMSSSMFNHSNLLLTAKLDKFMAFLIITPSIHLIHHSDKHQDMNSNYGFFLSWWDRCFKTLRMTSISTNELKIGIRGVGFEYQNILSMLRFPWFRHV